MVNSVFEDTIQIGHMRQSAVQPNQIPATSAAQPWLRRHSAKKIDVRVATRGVGTTIILCGFVFLSLLWQSAAEGAWNVSGDVALFPTLGNLYIKDPVFEFEASLEYKNHIGGAYALAASYMKPAPAGVRERENLDLTSIWLMRSAAFDLFSRNFIVSAGPGISIIDWQSERSEMLYGSFSFRSDIAMTIWNFQGFSVSLGGAYRGCPLKISGLITDRLGFVMFITG
jgi:hypothetical protein